MSHLFATQLHDIRVSEHCAFGLYHVINRITSSRCFIEVPHFYTVWDVFRIICL